MRSALDPGAAAALVADGATVMIGGFMGVGSPSRIARSQAADRDSQGVWDVTDNAWMLIS